MDSKENLDLAAHMKDRMYLTPAESTDIPAESRIHRLMIYTCMEAERDWLIMDKIYTAIDGVLERENLGATDELRTVPETPYVTDLRNGADRAPCFNHLQRLVRRVWLPCYEYLLATHSRWMSWALWCVIARLDGARPYYVPLMRPRRWKCKRCGKTFPRKRSFSTLTHEERECTNPPEETANAK